MSIDLKTYQFPIQTVALIFFDQTTFWLRHKDKIGLLQDKNGAIGTRREGSKIPERLYTLDEIRRIGHSLRRSGYIDDTGLRNCIARIDSMEKPVFKRKRRRG